MAVPIKSPGGSQKTSATFYREIFAKTDRMGLVKEYAEENHLYGQTILERDNDMVQEITEL